jgi:hypothetical protein
MGFYRFIKNLFRTSDSLKHEYNSCKLTNKKLNELIELQFKVIDKGADIMRAQGGLLNMVEQPLFSKLAQPENWTSTVIAPSWMTRVKHINNMISEYQKMVYDLNYFYNEKQD